VAWEYRGELDQTQGVVDGAITDAGESQAMNLGRARPFSALQQRLGRRELARTCCGRLRSLTWHSMFYTRRRAID